ncbi:MAG TPA: ABC transporter permease [Gammaproteobacteria bacterium]
MERLRGFRRRFRFPWRSDAEIRRDVDDELEFHLSAKADALQQEGLSAEAARKEALRQFGDLAAARERLVVEDRGGERRLQQLRLFDDLWRDLAVAARSLRRSTAFTAVAVLMLALGIGVVSAAFHLVNIYAFKPALIQEPDRVLSVYSVQPPRDARLFSYAEYSELRDRVETFASLAAHSIGEAGIEEGDVTRRGQATFVSAGYFDTLGVPPALGRGFTLAEERGDEPPTVVVSHDLWVRNGADPNLIGSLVRVNGEALVVVGVAARGFTGTMALMGSDAWLPLAAAERIGTYGDTRPNLADPQNRSLFLFGRLADGVSAAEAGVEVAALAPLITTNLPDSNGDRYTYIAGKMQRSAMSSAPSGEAEPIGRLLLPIAMSGVVLLIACLNLANMFLARGASRRNEMAIRQSLGSGRLRLVRQLMTEGLLLATLGGVLGLIWTYWAANWVTASASNVVPLGITLTVDTRPDLRVLLVTLGTCVAAALLFGLGPAWRVTGTDVLSGLKESAGDVQFKRRRARTIVSGKSLLMIAQIALSLAMLTAGGLFIRSALEAADATPSFDLDATLLVELDPSLVGNDETRVRALYARVVERVRALPEVEGASLASLVPFSGITRDNWVQPAGAPPGENTAFGHYTVIGDDYFDTLDSPVLRGRGFTVSEATSDTGPRVAIVSESLARRLFPDVDALGRLIQISPQADEEPVAIEIVGIAPGMPASDFDSAPRQHLYVPFGQAYTAGMSLLILARDNVADPARLLDAIRDEIREVDPALPVLSMMTMREYRDKNWTLWFTRMGGQVFTLLGLVGLFMAMVGLYGVTAFLTSRRTREIGIRMALGATRGAVLRRFMREGILLTAAGIALGLLLGLGTGQLLSSQLYGVSPTDPWVLLGASSLLMVAAIAASWLPVRRALRVEPSAALRHE